MRRHLRVVGAGLHAQVAAGAGRVQPVRREVRQVDQGRRPAIGDAEAVQHLGDVMRVDARQVERDDPATGLGVQRPVQLDRGHLARKRVEGVGDEVALVFPHGVHADVHQVSRGHAKADRIADRRGPGLELPGHLVEFAPAEMDLADHLAAGEERRHRLEQLAPRP